jgi:hypothetical protein
MKNLIYLLLALPLLFTSCSNEDMATSEESVQVSFCAEIPQPMGTRASSTLSVDKVYCAVFENGVEITNLRQDIDIVESQSIIFAPSLIKGRTYDIVFWASKAGAYDVTDLTAITRTTGSAATESDFDAFTAHIDVFVSNDNQPKPIVLTRPLAQLNLGVTPEDWDGVASVSTFNMTPTNITISLTGKDTFNALTGLVTGDDKSISYNLSVSGSEFTIEEKTYKNIAMCYVLPDAQKENFDITFSINDQNGDAIRSNVAINTVPLQANYKTNVVVRLLTGTVTYNNITLQPEYNNTENKEIE